MNKTSRFALWALSIGLSLGTATAQYAPQGPPPPPPPGGYQNGPGGYQNGPGGWDAPPPDFHPAAQQGFRDGLEGARKDYENHRRPNVNNRDEFRHPNVPRSDRRDYRNGFRRGYDVGVQHMMGGGPGPRY